MILFNQFPEEINEYNIILYITIEQQLYFIEITKKFVIEEKYVFMLYIYIYMTT